MLAAALSALGAAVAVGGIRVIGLNEIKLMGRRCLDRLATVPPGKQS
jgi:hypothetical protein